MDAMDVTMPDRHGAVKMGPLSHGHNYAQPTVGRSAQSGHTGCMDQLTRIREERGLSQTQLAEMIGANQATISKIERGQGNPTLTMIRRIAAALSCEPADLFSRDALQARVMEALNAIDPARREAALTVIEAMAEKQREQDAQMQEAPAPQRM